MAEEVIRGLPVGAGAGDTEVPAHASFGTASDSQGRRVLCFMWGRRTVKDFDVASPPQEKRTRQCEVLGPSAPRTTFPRGTVAGVGAPAPPTSSGTPADVAISTTGRSPDATFSRPATTSVRGGVRGPRRDGPGGQAKTTSGTKDGKAAIFRAGTRRSLTIRTGIFYGGRKRGNIVSLRPPR